MLKLGTSMAVPTVTVKHPDTPGQWMVVNQADYRPELHGPALTEAEERKLRQAAAKASGSTGGSDTQAPAPSSPEGAVSSEKTAPREGAAGETVREMVLKVLGPLGYQELKAKAKEEGVELPGNPSKEALLNALADKLGAE